MYKMLPVVNYWPRHMLPLSISYARCVFTTQSSVTNAYHCYRLTSLLMGSTHKIPEQLKWAVLFMFPWPSPVAAGPPRAGCWGPRPGSFWRPSRRPLSPWAACASAPGVRGSLLGSHLCPRSHVLTWGTPGKNLASLLRNSSKFTVWRTQRNTFWRLSVI